MNNYLSYKTIWYVSAPLLLSLIAQNIVGLTDTIFLGHLNEIALGASAIASIYYMIFFMAGFGFGTGMQILISRRNGEGNFADIGRIFMNGNYVLLLLSIVFIVLSQFTTPLFFSYYLSSQNIREAANSYMEVRIYGLFFAFLSTSFRAFYVGIAKTRVLGINAIIMASVNIALDYALIFGKWGFPAMGIAGAALASVISEIVSLLFLAAITFGRFNYKPYFLLASFKIKTQIIKVASKISFFIMFQNIFSIGAWFIFFIIIEKRGEHALAVSNIIRSVYNMLALPIWAFSSTTNSFVSNALGEKKKELIFPIIKRITLFCTVVVAGICLVSFIFKMPILSIFSEDKSLLADCLIPFRIISVSAVFMGLGYTVFSGVSGTGKTNIAMILELISLAIYLFSAYLFSIVFKFPIDYVWYSEIVYGVFLFLFSILYLRFGKWRSYTI